MSSVNNTKDHLVSLGSGASKPHVSFDLFALGDVVITANAQAVLSRSEVLVAIERHAMGDWGDVRAEDRLANERALRDGLRLLSEYVDGNGVCFWIITEADRSSTCILLPEDY